MSKILFKNSNGQQKHEGQIFEITSRQGNLLFYCSTRWTESAYKQWIYGILLIELIPFAYFTSIFKTMHGMLDKNIG